VKLKTAAFMAERTGEEFQAVLTSIFPYGTFIEVIDPPVDGLVRTQDVSESPARKGRPKKSRKRTIGEVVPVKLIRVDRSRGLLEFSFI
jgi:exoribonuclease R